MKLDGVKVLDLSAFLPGPHLTMMMADHGADVVMVEPDNGMGEPTRHMGEKYPDGKSVWFGFSAWRGQSIGCRLRGDQGN